MSGRVWIAAQVAVVALVLAAAIYGFATSAPPPPGSAASGSPTAKPSPVARSAAPTPKAPPSASPTPAGPTPSPSPTPTRTPLALAPYAFNGHSYTGVTLGTGWTILAPFDGQVETHLYQLVNGSIREGTDVAGVPTYPYVIVTAADGRKMTYRPGATGTDTRVTVQPGSVRSGDALFDVIGTGTSSWHDFYDNTVSFQIVVSLTGASGADLDASALIKAR
jgi:hypothetical protein